MARLPTVKARAHHGARSLDLTVPAETRARLDINPGDIFTVTAEKDAGKVVLRYTRVFPEK